MPLEKEIGDAATALSQNQYTDALDGTYWINGWDATLGDGDLEVEIAPGEGAINTGEVETTETQTVDFAGDVDADDPRKAVISVDDTGTVQKTLGNATPASPEGEVRERTVEPSPPTNAPGVVVAEVWIAAAATELVSDDVRDRRVSNNAVEDFESDATLSVDGYTDISDDRSIDETYTNNTGKTINVSILILTEVTDFIAELIVDDSTVDHWGMSVEQSSNRVRVQLNGLVPPGSEYKLRILGDDLDGDISSWYEQEISIS